jgi:hypothetical protein
MSYTGRSLDNDEEQTEDDEEGPAKVRE